MNIFAKQSFYAGFHYVLLIAKALPGPWSPEFPGPVQMDVNRPNSHLSIVLQSNSDHLLLFFGVSAWLMSSGASRDREPADCRFNGVADLIRGQCPLFTLGPGIIE